jgi:hypothetical protein
VSGGDGEPMMDDGVARRDGEWDRRVESTRGQRGRNELRQLGF